MFVSEEDGSNFTVERILRVWEGEQEADGYQHSRDSVGRGPVVFENVEADVSIFVDVWVVYFGLEGNFRWLHRVIEREGEG